MPQITSFFNEDTEQTQVIIVQGEERKRFFKEDEGGELHALALAVAADSENEEKLASLIKALTPKELLKQEFSKITADGFEYRNGRAYLEGTYVPIPEAIATQINRHAKEGSPFEPIVRFWALAMLNPNIDARDRFFEYCMNYGATLTPSGHVFLYKAVVPTVSLDVDEKLVQFVEKLHARGVHSATYPDSEVWVSPFMNSYQIRLDSTLDPVPMGLNLVNPLKKVEVKVKDKHGLKAHYTDKYSRTMDIQLGTPATKNRNECDPNIHNECSHGLHVGSYKYVNVFGSWKDDAILGCLVNPANVVALPHYDNSKIRVCEYYPHVVMTRDENDGSWVEIPSGYTEEDYREFEIKSFKNVFESGQVDGQNVVITQQVLDYYS